MTPRPSVQSSIPDVGGREIVAIGATDREGVFITFVAGVGFEYVDLTKEAEWSTAAEYTGPLLAKHGLHFSTSGSEAYVSFAESRQVWNCLRVRLDGAETEPVLTQNTLPQDIVAVCSAPHDATLAVALATGTVRFLDARSGKSAAKGLKPELQPSSKVVGLLHAGGGRAVLILGSAEREIAAEFFVISLDTESRRCTVNLSGSVSGESVVPGGAGHFVGAQVLRSHPCRVLFCWTGQNGARGDHFASAVLDCEAPALTRLSSGSGCSGPAVWSNLDAFLLEWTSGASGPFLRVRDTTFGMTVASAESLKIPSGTSVTSAGTTTVLLSKRRIIQAFHFALPAFSLHTVLGQGFKDSPCDLPTPLHEAICGKRERDDATVDALFTSKRHKTTDVALASEVRSRRVRPSRDLVDTIVHHRCWASAVATIGLPELDEDLSVHLLVARPQLLPAVVRRARGSNVLSVALRDNLPDSKLAGIVEVLLQWIQVYREFPADEVRKSIPMLPSLSDIVEFLGVLVDGCLQSLVRMDAELIEKVVQALSKLQSELGRNERLCGSVRAAFRAKPGKSHARAPMVELTVLPL